MPSDFTPPLAGAAVFYLGAAWPSGISLWENGDALSQANIRPDLEMMIEADEHLRYRINEVDRAGGILDVIAIKLGIALVADDATLIDWTDSGGLTVSVMTTPSTLIDGINDLDQVLDAQRTRLDVLVPRVMPAGDSGPFPPYDVAPTAFGATDDHHTAISALDVQLATTDATAVSAAADATTALASIGNLEDKLGVGAASSAGPFDFTYNYVVGDDPLEDVINRVDQELFGLHAKGAGLIHALAFGGANGSASAISDFGDVVTEGGFVAGSSTATIVLEENRILGPGIAVIQLPQSGANVRLVWEPNLTGITVRGNSNDGAGTLVNMPWNTLTAIPAGGLGGQYYFEITLPTADHYAVFMVVYTS